jgi:hypothetical protein
MADWLKKLQAIDSHPILNVGYKIVGILAALVVVGGVVVGLAHVHKSRSGQPSHTISTGAPSASSRRSDISRSSDAVPTVGTCLDSASRSVSCDVSHQSEVYSTGPACQVSALLAYLGGIADVDVLSPSIQPSSVRYGQTSLCVVRIPALVTIPMSARDVLVGEAGDVWRRCLISDFANREVPCSQPHTDEFVFSGQLKAGEPLDCGARATQYLGSEFSNHSDTLTVVSATQGQLSQCLVQVLGDNWLTRSVRRLGQAAVPISPR